MTGLRVRLRYTPAKFTDRADHGRLPGRPEPGDAADANVSTQLAVHGLPALEAGASKTFEITATPVQLGLPSFGVYPIAVEVARVQRPIVMQQRTYLTYAPPTPQKPPRNRLAIALPIIDQPHRAENDNFIDDKLGAQLTGKGRLAELAGIAATAPKSVTWFVDPALLDDAQALSKPHRLKGKSQAADPNAAQVARLAAHRAGRLSGRGHAVRRSRRGRARPSGPGRPDRARRSRWAARSPRSCSSATCR